MQIELPDGQSIAVSLNYKKDSKGEMRLAGSVIGKHSGTFFISADQNKLVGSIALADEATSYEYTTTSSGEVILSAKATADVLCIGLPPVPVVEGANAQQAQSQFAANAPQAAANNLQSLPGAEACVYLDYDGHYLPPGSRWNNGNPINAAPFNLDDAGIRESWEVVAEDYRPFNINITTSKAVFDSYPPKRRMWCVFTTTTTAAPGAGGVAYVSSFGFLENEVCWVFQGGAKFSGEAASHEIGHTLSLRHDGLRNPDAVYFSGHGDWAPIMGVGYGKDITQFSRGEYNRSNNSADDFSKMDDFIFFRNDDHGNNLNNATVMNKSSSGALNRQTGVITTRGDRDVFRFTCGTGDVTMDINTVSRHGNLDILVRLYEGASGNQIGVFNGNGLNTRLTAFLDAGTYYIGVEGTGTGNPATNGYSDYGSLGSFSVTGNVPPGGGGGGGGGNNNAVATIYKDCSFSGSSIELTEGRFNLAALTSRGLLNDDASSMRLQAGYTAVLYKDDNFSGPSITITGDDTCFTDNFIPNENFNDELSSITISRSGGSNNNNAVTFIEAENYSEMSGIQTENSSEGGQNVGYIDQGDFMTYRDINFPSSGNYKIEYRVASIRGGRRLSSDLNSGNIVLGEVNIPNTGGWQNWTTVSQTVRVNAGTYQFGVFASTSGWNLNWIRITAVGNAQASTEATSLGAALIADTAHRVGTILYPNPAVNSIQVNFEGKSAEIAVFDLQGRQVIPQASVTPGTSVDVSSLKKGLYMVVIDKDGTKETKRLVKQ